MWSSSNCKNIGVVVLLLTVRIVSLLALKVQETETRDATILDGLWNFRKADMLNPEVGFAEQWYRTSFCPPMTKSCIKMPVPSSYNDISQDRTLRDHVGWVWYERQFFVPFHWSFKKERVVIRFESVHYFARVWINGLFVIEHEGGHLPFEAEVQRALNWTSINRITVAVNNTLTPFTLPCGRVVYPNNPDSYPPGYFYQQLIFDFFNYAGIHRSVKLYTTPLHYISDIFIVTTAKEGLEPSLVRFNVCYSESEADNKITRKSATCAVQMLDAHANVVARLSECTGELVIAHARLWWPFTMDANVGYLYTLKVELSVDEEIVDVYRQKFGLRTVRVGHDGMYINNRFFYFRGFGKHEDFHIFGRGFNLPVMIKDFNLLQWSGANSFRTSHYPYAEEVLDYADEHGIVVINESPAVGLHEFPNETLKHHLKVMTELIQRDRNHPSVIMWSVANEPKSYDKGSEFYFRTVINLTKSLDATRPVTFVIGGSNASLDKAAGLVDILCINHYFAWYSDPGKLQLIPYQLSRDIKLWASRFTKPVIITEYGADTITGLHTNPSSMFSEEYQTEFMAQYHGVFDQLRQDQILTGEMVWNFADFMTDQEVNRVWGNRKGVFTRERQPKTAAHFLRHRYWKLAMDIDRMVQVDLAPRSVDEHLIWKYEEVVKWIE
ncbi:beta-glucuronidase-like isoform X2 [Paramacrobiotus metropolitanus]|uniref:beta-glucuronidase-like isoform X2 n=1 Tax=Paramacrobiotus metropolitanus TaxID=2943436 RepID=UPI0024458635|nr:beta-glucuronidase-like isoform X2 [Paramacrobiotus metropolitanus]